jgi:hypothetical protein
MRRRREWFDGRVVVVVVVGGFTTELLAQHLSGFQDGPSKDSHKSSDDEFTTTCFEEWTFK